MLRPYKCEICGKDVMDIEDYPDVPRVCEDCLEGIADDEILFIMDDNWDEEDDDE